MDLELQSRVWYGVRYGTVYPAVRYGVRYAPLFNHYFVQYVPLDQYFLNSEVAVLQSVHLRSHMDFFAISFFKT